jgi:hypothetical protein
VHIPRAVVLHHRASCGCSASAASKSFLAMPLRVR